MLSIDRQQFFSLYPDFVRDFSGASIFVTGATGFFGTWILQTFAAAVDELGLKARIVALTRKSPTFEHRSIDWVQGSMESFDFPKQDISHVLHFATPKYQGRGQENAADNQVMIDGAKRIHQLCAEKQVARLLFTSSGAVYEDNFLAKPQPLQETSPTVLPIGADNDPTQTYGTAKCESERVLLEPTPNSLQTVIARCFTSYGPYLPISAPFAISNFARSALEGKDIVIESDGRAIRSFLYGLDLSVWIWKLLAKATSGETYNVGAAEPTSIANLAEALAQLAPKPLSVQTLSPPSQTPPHCYWPDTTKAQQELQLKTWTPLPTGLQRYLEWLAQSR